MLKRQAQVLWQELRAAGMDAWLGGAKLTGDFAVEVRASVSHPLTLEDFVRLAEEAHIRGCKMELGRAPRKAVVLS